MLKSRFILKLFRFTYCTNIQVKCLKYSEHGDPLKVINQKIETFSNIKKLQSNEILIKFKSAVIHPSDINTIQGQYPLKPPLPAICGNEGYAEVIDCGSSSCLKPGDPVIPRDMNSGTWTTHRVCTDRDVIKLPRSLPPEIGAITAVNPCTAYRMLKDFTRLERGSIVIQNGGTSAVAIYATQLARLWGVTSISIIRARGTPGDTSLVKDVLRDRFGASFVLTEEEARTELDAVIERTGRARLALNCVGGKSVLPLLKVMEKSGIVVTYGGMSRQPLQVPISSLIFSDINIRGFWMSAWSEMRRDSLHRQEMLDELCDGFHSGSIKPSPFVTYDFGTEWKEAISKSMFTDETPQQLKNKNIMIMRER